MSKLIPNVYKVMYLTVLLSVIYLWKYVWKSLKTNSAFKCILQTWTHLDEDYQALTRQLETVETSIPSVGLVEESEERLAERIALYQVIIAFWDFCHCILTHSQFIFNDVLDV